MCSSVFTVPLKIWLGKPPSHGTYLRKNCEGEIERKGERGREREREREGGGRTHMLHMIYGALYMDLVKRRERERVRTVPLAVKDLHGGA